MIPTPSLILYFAIGHFCLSYYPFSQFIKQIIWILYRADLFSLMRFIVFIFIIVI